MTLERTTARWMDSWTGWTADFEIFEMGGKVRRLNAQTSGMGALTCFTRISNRHVSQGCARIDEEQTNTNRWCIINKHIFQPRPSCVDFDGRESDTWWGRSRRPCSTNGQICEISCLVIRIIRMIVLIQIDATIHAVAHVYVAKYCSCVTRIIDVPNDDSSIALVDAQIFKQRNTVLNPNTSSFP